MMLDESTILFHSLRGNVEDLVLEQTAEISRLGVVMNHFFQKGSFPNRASDLDYVGAKENGLLHVPKGQAQNPQAQMFSDPNMAMEYEEKSFYDHSTTLTFAWVNFFFSGFVAAKIPFPLTQRFRAMLQNGIDLSTVDVSYVSSRSWYFLNLFGLRGLFSLILGEDNATDDAQRMMQMGGFGFDPTRSLGAEKDGLDIVQHDWALPKFEQRATAVLKKLVS
ncbi:UNVERIFIED_CONTAM: ER membrane protein complex subunit [Sesamum calycinum]|uniref:ER membrane protein complex subunit 3 n=1 Tax=Sesamum calycinum TaxID=2727403 RepID=A0AAW2Q5S0_9LAMI